MAACSGTNKKGEPCKAPVIVGTDRCIAHSSRELQETAGFGGAQPGAGRPRRPREIELIEQVAEEYRDELRRVLVEGLTAEAPVVVGGNSKDAHVEMVPDHRQQLATFREIVDRLHGRPKQMTELSGPDGAPITVASTFDLSRLSVEEKRSLLELLEKADAGTMG